MAIEFVNIRRKETQLADTEAKIAALWESSDHSTNISQGQDFGWRLAPSVVVEMKRIMSDRKMMTEIARHYDKILDELKEYDVLYYMSELDDLKKQSDNPPEDHSDAYYDEIRALERKNAIDAQIDHAMPDPIAAPETTTTTTESLADLEKRVELEERLAKARATTAEETTTTTTEAPKTTTTTTAAKTTTTTTEALQRANGGKK